MKRDDTLWKGILEDLFDDFLRFFYLNADDIFDMSRGFDFLDKELEDNKRKLSDKDSDLKIKKDTLELNKDKFHHEKNKKEDPTKLGEEQDIEKIDLDAIVNLSFLFNRSRIFIS